MDELTQGQQLVKQYQDAGFGSDQIDDFVNKTTDQYRSAGFNDDQIKQYWGTKERKPDNSAIQEHVKGNMALNEYKNPHDPQTPVAAENIWDAMKAGWQTGVTGLWLNNKKPDTYVPQDASRWLKIASSMASMAGDLPAMVAGGTAGAAAGAGAGTFTVPGVGTIAGGVVAGAAGAFAAPAAMRKMLMDEYDHPEGVRNASDFANRVVGATWEAAKGGITGAASALAGGWGGALYGTAGKLAAEVGAMTTVSSALEGHLPDADEFINGAIAIGGLHAAGSFMPNKMRRVYADTGSRPPDVIETADKDPAFKGELLGIDPSKPETASSKTMVEEDEQKIQPKPAVDTSKMNLSEDEKTVLDSMRQQPEEAKDSVWSKVKDWWNNNTDYTTNLVKQAKDVGFDVPAEKNPQFLLNTFPAWSDKLRAFKEWGTIDFNSGKSNGESFDSIIKDLKKMDPKDPDTQIAKFEAYAVSRRTIELLATRDIKQTGNIDTHIRVAEANSEKFQPILDRVTAWSNKSIDYLKESGVISEESAGNIKEANKNYVPLWKIQDEDPITGITKGGPPRVPKEIGDSAALLSGRPIENILRNTESFIKAAEINRTKSAWFEQQLMAGEDAIVREVDPRSDLNATRDEYWVDGKRKVVEADADTIESIKRLQGNDGALNVFGELTKAWAQAVRIGTVNNPAFGLRHSLRNQISGATYSVTGMRPFEGLFHLPDIWMKSDMYKRMVVAGGAVNEIMKTNESYLDGEVYKLNGEAPFIGKAWNTLKDVGSFTHAMIVANDNAIRLREFKGLVAEGKSDIEAAAGARGVLPDYQKAGLQQSALKAATAFLNVHMVSMDRMMQEFADPAKRMSFVGKNIAYITTISMLMKAANHGDDTIDDLPNYMKNLYWCTRLDNWRPANSLAEAMSVQKAYPSSVRAMKDGSWQVNDGTIIRIPKPFTNGVVFGSGIDAMIDQFSGKHPAAMADWVKAVAGTVLVDPIPNAIAPAIEQMTNKNLFTGQSIVRQSMENKLPEMQYDRYTSETAKALGKLVSYMPLVKDIGPKDSKLGSPAVIDNYIHAWGGTLGQYAIQIADKGLQAAGIAPPIVKPASTLSDIPFVREFVVRFPTARPEQIEQFQDRFAQSDKIQNSIKALQKQGDFQGAMALNDRYMRDASRVSGINKGIQTLNQQIQYVYANPSISPVDKRQLIDTYMYQMVMMAKTGTDAMDNWQKMYDSRKQGK